MYHKLVDFGTYNLHIVSGSFNTGTEKSNGSLSKILKGAYQILYDSQARCVDYETISESMLYLLFFCATPWVKNKIVADQLLVVWPDQKTL